MERAEQKVAIVTGAGSKSGMGKELAEHLISKDWLVACCDINPRTGQIVTSSLGKNATFFHLDVCDYDSQAKVFSQVWQKWHRLDALLAHAGHGDRSSIYILDRRGEPEVPPKPALQSLKACYEGCLYGVQLAIHFMRINQVPRGGGGGWGIVATSSIASVHPHQTFPEYCGAKAAINQFVRTAAPILRLKDNITLNAILPGIVPTGAVPQASLDVTNPEHLTPIETVLIECSTDKYFFLPRLELANGEATKRACTVWEPLFESKHSEISGLGHAIP
ncbi:hypothetical protein BDW59DRAFT_175395 [Aspergillus cavernicola]|uniref:15-hydroxyprostaglandin dehydrogenase n=1 Tax=Aspergillus cavernicola TaxID=176166 RepID=A0ABR4HQA2_9EURO